MPRSGYVLRFACLWSAVHVLSACSAGQNQPSRTIEAGGWTIEAEDPRTRVTFAGQQIDIQTPAGVTVWYKRELTGPVTISFEAMAVSNGGPHDHVSDLNAFWMARNADGSPVLSRRRSGAFAGYDDMLAYYVGIGGNRNTTTRFRRYVGQAGNRPLLPEHDRRDAADMLKANVWTRITLKADGASIDVERDRSALFHLDDRNPYAQGHFGFRTTKSHIRIRNFRISQDR